ncbi:divalent-cation tolerance protein CutA [Methylopila sp. M107]|uniref:divalent-cation tolerance protein CutA n=1 Tax=Methylopila sp. M107 TaxID=1101190 RepID=UPI00037C670E|nr:divalent-cation tolerance protein CutA [Methylopila sp. M107]
MTEIVDISTTTDDRAVAERIARAAIDRRVAACARIHAVDSIFRWNGAVETAAEFVVELKTTETARGAAEALLRELHNYELPEILVRPIIGGSQAYLDWVASEVD